MLKFGNREKNKKSAPCRRSRVCAAVGWLEKVLAGFSGQEGAPGQAHTLCQKWREKWRPPPSHIWSEHPPLSFESLQLV